MVLKKLRFLFRLPPPITLVTVMIICLWVPQVRMMMNFSSASILMRMILLTSCPLRYHTCYLMIHILSATPLITQLTWHGVIRAFLVRWRTLIIVQLTIWLTLWRWVFPAARILTLHKHAATQLSLSPHSHNKLLMSWPLGYCCPRTAVPLHSVLCHLFWSLHRVPLHSLSTTLCQPRAQASTVLLLTLFSGPKAYPSSTSQSLTAGPNSCSPPHAPFSVFTVPPPHLNPIFFNPPSPECGYNHCPGRVTATPPSPSCPDSAHNTCPTFSLLNPTYQTCLTFKSYPWGILAACYAHILTGCH